MKRNKGFTLIELLAVIVVLAIIALIAVPIILGIIEKAEKGAAKASALGYIDAVEKYMVLSQIDNNKIKLEPNKTYQISRTTYEELSFMDILIPKVYAEEVNETEEIFLEDIIKVKGDSPESGIITIDENNRVEYGVLDFKKYEVIYGKDKSVTEVYKLGNIEVRSIRITNDNIEVKAGETLQLNVEILPKRAIKNAILKYESSDETVATVSSTGLVTTYKKGDVTITVTSSNGKSSSYKIKFMKEPGDAVYLDPTNLTNVCNAGNAVSRTGTKTGCMKWYVYRNNGDGTYQLILDHNTTAGVAWNSTGYNSSMKEVAVALASDISDWDDSLKNNNARLITANEIAELTGASDSDKLQWNSNKPYGKTVGTQISYFYFDGLSNGSPRTYANGWDNSWASSTRKSKYAWLYDYTNGCIMEGCNVEDNSTNGYWTNTRVSDQTARAWCVRGNGDLRIANVNITSQGVRPVITISASSL